MAEAPKKKYIRWIVLFVVTGVVDIAQILLDLTGVGVAVSEAIEIAMPFVMAGILLIFKILNVQTGISVAIAVVTDAITGGFAPFWIGDAWYVYRKVRKQEAAQANTDDANAQSGPLNRAGVRSPAGQRAPLNANGVRSPSNTAVSESDENAATDSQTEETGEDEGPDAPAASQSYDFTRGNSRPTDQAKE